MHGQNICIMTAHMSPLYGVGVREPHSEIECTNKFLELKRVGHQAIVALHCKVVVEISKMLHILEILLSELSWERPA